MRVIDTSHMDRPAWLDFRVDRQGASDSVVIAGLNKHKSRFGLWLEKTRQAEPEEAGEEARWGLRLEDDIFDEVREQLGIYAMATQVMIEHPDFPWLTATLDMVDEADEIHELKAVGFHSGKGLEDGTVATLPDGWLVQGNHQMACGGKERMFFHVFVGGRLKMLNFCLYRDDAVVESVIQLNTEFRRHVETRTPPTEFDPQDAAVLLKHYRAVEGEEIVNSNPKLARLCESYEIATSAAKFQAELADQCKAALLAQMATAPALRCQNYLMRRSTVNVKAQPPKPKAAYSYTKFTFTNTESDE